MLKLLIRRSASKKEIIEHFASRYPRIAEIFRVLDELHSADEATRGAEEYAQQSAERAEALRQQAIASAQILAQNPPRVYHRRAHTRIHRKEIGGKVVFKVIDVCAHDALAPTKGIRRRHKSQRPRGRLQLLEEAVRAGLDGIP
jgi:hypothetical protein